MRAQETEYQPSAPKLHLQMIYDIIRTPWLGILKSTKR